MALAVIAMIGTWPPVCVSRGADGSGRREPIHLGHLAIHEDAGIRNLRKSCQRFLPVGDHIDPAAEIFQHADRHFLIHHIVFCHQNAGVVICGLCLPHAMPRAQRLGLTRLWAPEDGDQTLV